MTNNPNQVRKRYDSPVRREGYRESRIDRGPHRYDRDYNRDSEKRRHVDKDSSDRRLTPKEPLPLITCPPGFPKAYTWSKGDWLCPSKGCEGYVTNSKWRNCIHCGRSQPHFMMLMEMAKNDRFRVDICPDSSCRMRDCPSAHSDVELRNYEKSREYRKGESSASPSVVCPSPTDLDFSAFCKRWKIVEPGVSILKRLPGILGDLVLRSFMLPPEIPDSELTNQLLKCLADIIRPQSRRVTDTASLHETMVGLLKVHSNPIGVACNESGQLAISVDKQVAVIRVKDFGNEDLGLLGYALTFAGLSVVHSNDDKTNLIRNFPSLFCDLFDRVRLVDNPSEIVYIATDPVEEVIDRSTQARIDAVTSPAPLLPTPPQSSDTPHELNT
jgi:hypothetical protein